MRDDPKLRLIAEAPTFTHVRSVAGRLPAEVTKGRDVWVSREPRWSSFILPPSSFSGLRPHLPRHFLLLPFIVFIFFAVLFLLLLLLLFFLVVVLRIAHPV